MTRAMPLLCQELRDYWVPLRKGREQLTPLPTILSLSLLVTGAAAAASHRHQQQLSDHSGSAGQTD